jgi:hypothetical protein
LIDRHPDTRFIFDHLVILQPIEPPTPLRPWVQRHGKADQQLGAVAPPGQRVRDRLDGGQQAVEHRGGLLASDRRWACLIPEKAVDTTAAAVGGGSARLNE